MNPQSLFIVREDEMAHRRRSFAVHRRGVLLLVVLSMLTLFLMLGTAYLVTATRSRETARAYSRLTFGGAGARVPHGQLFDTVMLRILHGVGSAPTAIGASGSITEVRFESLLADKYGLTDRYGTALTLTGSCEGPPAITGPLVTATIALTGRTLRPDMHVRPTDLNGRILTFAAPGRPVSSHRILRARSLNGATVLATNTSTVSGASSLPGRFQIILDLPQSATPFVPPGAGLVFVNGREFAGEPPAGFRHPTGGYFVSGSAIANAARRDGLLGRPLPSNEAWDGFDAHNPLLARLAPSSVSPSHAVVTNFSLVPTSGTSQLSSAVSASVRLSGTLVSGTMLQSPWQAISLGPAFDYDGDLIPDGADNDNDGVPDGVFLDFGIPDFDDGFGNCIQVRASVLVVDLDGRFNVNAHGDLTASMYSSPAQWSTHPDLPQVFNPPTNHYRTVPSGGGYGPPEIQPNLAFGTAAVASLGAGEPKRLFECQHDGLTVGENPGFFMLAGGSTARQVGVRPSGSRFAPVPTARLNAIQGKYGEQSPGDWNLLSLNSRLSDATFPYPRPGIARVDDVCSQQSDRLVRPDQQRLVGSGTLVSNGVPPLWWDGSSDFNWFTKMIDGAVQPRPRGIYNSPPDLHGRVKAFAFVTTGSEAVPRMGYANPEWSDRYETVDDPYEFRIDTRKGFGGYFNDPGFSGTPGAIVFSHNPFTLAELEPVLRPYDIDTNRLPPRLAVMLGSSAENNRQQITTDAWDTTVITGFAVRRLFGAPGVNGWLTGPSVVNAPLYGDTAATGLLGGEAARGEKFNLNRPLIADPRNAGYDPADLYYIQRQAYFKDLYLLLYALADEDLNGNGVLDTNSSEDANGNGVLDRPEEDTNGNGVLDPGEDTNSNGRLDSLAQWVANIIEFRDGDSRMTPFEYDDNPRDGWTVDGSVETAEANRRVVWGAERPEFVIGEAVAWRKDGNGGLVLSLHRPWDALAYPAGTASPIAAEPCDPAFEETPAVPQNQIDLRGKAGALNYATGSRTAGGTGAFPIWRLRLNAGGGNRYVRFDDSDSTTDVRLSETSSGTAKLAAGAWLCITGTGTLPITIDGQKFPNRLTLGAATGASFFFPGEVGPMTSGTVYLERLADPTASGSGSLPQTAAPLAPGPLEPRYVVVDSAVVQVQDVGEDGLVTTRRTLSGTGAFWQAPRPGARQMAIEPLSISSAESAVDRPWYLPWPNRPFASAGELLMVPQGSAEDMLKYYERPAITSGKYNVAHMPVPADVLFEAVHVPTRFSGIHVSTGTGSASMAALNHGGIFPEVAPVFQFSSYREPGRVNINTITGSAVWNAVVGGGARQPPQQMTVNGATAIDPLSAGFSASPAKSLLQILSLSGTATVSGTNAFVRAMDVKNVLLTGSSVFEAGPLPVASGTSLALGRSPLHLLSAATRLASTATTRSNLFAIWVTLRESIPNDPDSVRYRRAFYVVDRSIPVGFDPGEDLDGDGVLDPPEDANGNGVLNTGEDRGNGILEPREDLNGNDQLDPGEDLNGNGSLDPAETNDIGDGVLDPGEDRNGNGMLDPPLLLNVWDCVRVRRIIE